MPTATQQPPSTKRRKGQPLAFRLDPEMDALLQERLGEQAIVGINSPDQMARKLVIDVLLGKAIYLVPKDRYTNPDLNR